MIKICHLDHYGFYTDGLKYASIQLCKGIGTRVNRECFSGMLIYYSLNEDMIDVYVCSKNARS